MSISYAEMTTTCSILFDRNEETVVSKFPTDRILKFNRVASIFYERYVLAYLPGQPKLESVDGVPRCVDPFDLDMALHRPIEVLADVPYVRAITGREHEVLLARFEIPAALISCYARVMCQSLDEIVRLINTNILFINAGQYRANIIARLYHHLFLMRCVSLSDYPLAFHPRQLDYHPGSVVGMIANLLGDPLCRENLNCGNDYYHADIVRYTASPHVYMHSHAQCECQCCGVTDPFGPLQLLRVNGGVFQDLRGIISSLIYVLGSYRLFFFGLVYWDYRVVNFHGSYAALFELYKFKFTGQQYIVTGGSAIEGHHVVLPFFLVEPIKLMLREYDFDECTFHDILLASGGNVSIPPLCYGKHEAKRSDVLVRMRKDYSKLNHRSILHGSVQVCSYEFPPEMKPNPQESDSEVRKLLPPETYEKAFSARYMWRDPATFKDLY